MKAQTKRLFGYAFLLVPVLVVTLLDFVPKFVYSSCTYYTCDPYTFSVTASPSSIALDESSTLEGINANCPCTWQIESQPGGWQLEVQQDCRAILKPIADFGYAGDIVVRATSSGSSGCSTTVTVTAGCPTFRVQLSTDGGYTWVSDGLTITGGQSPGQLPIDFAVRVVMTATSGEVDGWSFSLKHDASSVRTDGGDVEALAVTTIGTHTESVQAGSPPDFEETAPRQDATGSLGYIQGVVIDYHATAIMLASVGNFVTSGACYQISMPTAGGIYQVPFTFVDDLEDGNPPIEAMVNENGQTVTPNLRGFVLTIDTTGSYSSNDPCDLSQDWIVVGEDGIAAPLGSCGGTSGSGGGGGAEDCTDGMDNDGDGLVDCDDPDCSGDLACRTPLTPPFSCADANEDETINLTDAVFILSFLFRGGAQPFRIENPLTKTGQQDCYNNSTLIDPCPDEGQSFHGQDGNYQTGYALLDESNRYEIDEENGTVIDHVTGLMWTKAPIGPPETLFTYSEARDAVSDLDVGGFDDWVIPTVGELLSICDYETTNVFAFNPFVFDTNASQTRYWTQDTLPALDFGVRLRLQVNFSFGHINGDPEEQCPLYNVRARRRIKDKPHSNPAPAQFKNAMPFTYGDADASGGMLQLTDAVFILTFLFRGGPEPCSVENPMTQFVGIGSTATFIDNLDGTATDPRTGLTWIVEPSETLFTWQEALLEAETLTFAGESDWRVPNNIEIATLFLYQFSLGGLKRVSSSILRDNAFPAGSSTQFWLSDTVNTQPNKAWKADFEFGFIHNEFFDNEKELDENKVRVWPVRGGLTQP